jgi:thiamine-monophosphate kinase
MNEKDIIGLFLGALPAQSERIHPFFFSDAEAIEINGTRMLFTIDSFDSEDHFRTDDPRLLGRNLAACTISDILACGGSLSYFGHSVTIADDWDEQYIRAFSEGNAGVVAECGGRFAGGDLGRSPRWHYTGVALGVADRTLTRHGAKPGDRLFVTGEIGAGNFEAASILADTVPAVAAILYRNRIAYPLRLRESALIARFANACIDTSDGLLNALTTLSEVNGTGYVVEKIPYFEPGRLLVESLGLPIELLMAGECGEYELLCAVSPDREAAFLDAAVGRGVSTHRLGVITQPGIARVASDAQLIDFADFNISARAYGDHREYVRVLTEYLLAGRRASQDGRTA